jgi:exodeoxyribonuclease V alpha subunit
MPQPGDRISVASARIMEVRTRRDGGWCACILKVEQGPNDLLRHHIHASGLIPNANEGRYFACELSFHPHPKFGPQWKVERAVPTTPMTPAGLIAYLEETIPGIGPRRAAALVEQFGSELMNVLDADDAVQRVHSTCGISDKVAEGLISAWKTVREDSRLSVTLLDAGWSMTQVARARERFGTGIAAILASDPYRLMAIRGIGFKLADAVAIKIGIAEAHPGRLGAAAAHILEEEAGEGHCWMPFPDLVAGTATLLALEQATVDSRLAPLLGHPDRQRDALVIRDASDRCWLRRLWQAHQSVTNAVVRRISTPRDMGEAHQGLRPIDGLSLTAEQQAAVEGVIGRTLVILTGGPGTGKTTVIRAIIDACIERMHAPRIRLAAPTGKAAKRLSDSTGRDAGTIHRLLEWSDDGPRRNSGNPVEADVVVVDETSMLDLELAASLLEALPPACRLVLVGDVDQLPSVGPGQVLADLIAGGAPTYRLTMVHRQAQGSLILRAAHAVNEGTVPEPGKDFKNDDLFFVRQPEDDLLVERVVRMVSETVPVQRGIQTNDIRVLVPINRGNCGVDAINRRLRDRLNPADPRKAEIGKGEDVIRVGDRLVWLTNSAEYALVNGEELTLIGVDKDPKGLHAVLMADGDRRIRMPVASLDVRLAYAFTIHKSQGSEYPAVIIVLHKSAWRMLERRLLYTAITRAKKLCLLVGDSRALARAVDNLDSTGRRSGLADDLKRAVTAEE